MMLDKQKQSLEKFQINNMSWLIFNPEDLVID